MCKLKSIWGKTPPSAPVSPLYPQLPLTKAEMFIKSFHNLFLAVNSTQVAYGALWGTPPQWNHGSVLSSLGTAVLPPLSGPLLLRACCRKHSPTPTRQTPTHPSHPICSVSSSKDTSWLPLSSSHPLDLSRSILLTSFLVLTISNYILRTW